MNNFCIKCGAQLQDLWQHCINCGTKVNKESELTQGTVLSEPTNVPIQSDSLAKIPSTIRENKEFQKNPILIVSVIMLIALVVIISTKNNSNNQSSPSGDYQSSDTTDATQPIPNEVTDNSDILSRLNSNSSWEWFEDPGQMIGPYAKYQKFIEASYLADFCGVFVLTDEHSADPIFDNWGKKMTYWTITDSLTGKFIRIQTDSGTNVESRPCVIAAGNTFDYTLTNN